MSLYTQFGKQSTINDFILKFFSHMHGNELKGLATYFDANCTSIHCQPNRYRSFDDFYELVNTYYPGTTPEKLMHELLVADVRGTNGQDYFLFMSNCSTIDRIRMHYSPESSLSYGYVSGNKYNSKWSWPELLEMIGLRNPSSADIKNYIKLHRK